MGKWYHVWGQILVRHKQQIQAVVFPLLPHLELSLIHFLSLSVLLWFLCSEVFLWEVNLFNLSHHFTLLSIMLPLGLCSGWQIHPFHHLSCCFALHLCCLEAHLQIDACLQRFPFFSLLGKAAWECFLPKSICSGISMQNYPFAYGCMRGAEFTGMSNFRTNGCMVVTWNCMNMAPCWGGKRRLTVRALQACSYCT